ncbi:MAG TPA: hypothetical protein VGJ08_02660 [Rhizomicrobium sp.]
MSTPAIANTDQAKWSLSLYAGPSTNYIFTEVVAGRFHWADTMVGVALDRNLAYLGWGWSLNGEAQITQHFMGHTYNTAALGLGLEFDHFPWSESVPTSFAFYTGPSYTTNAPQQYSRSLWGSKKALLNYVSVELAFGIPNAANWDVEFRTFHRSGAWGIYTLDADENSMIGIGIRHRF